jgi:hypothetical protein
LFTGGGTLALAAGAWASAIVRGRNPRVDAPLAGGAYLCAALAVLAFIFGQPSDRQFDFPQFALSALASLLLFGALFGLGAGRYYRRRHPLLLAAGLVPIALLAGLLIFVLAYLLAGGNVLVVFGIVSMRWKVPVGLLLGGFFGALLPGILAEMLLGQGTRAPAPGGLHEGADGHI